MIYNPVTGTYGEYEAPTAAAGAGMTALGTAGVEAPLIFRMIEQSPGFVTAFGYSTFRGTNTLMRGGSAPELFKTGPTPDDFFGARRGQRKIDAGRAPFLRRSIQQNFPRPRNARQFTDLSIFADPSKNMYTPFGFSSLFGHPTGVLGSGKLGRRIGEKMFRFSSINQAESTFGPGTLSFLSAGTRIDRLERRAAAGSQKAAAKLAQVDLNLGSLQSLGNNAALTDAEFARLMSARQTGFGAGTVGTQGVRSAMMANVSAGQYTQAALGFKHAVMGHDINLLVGNAYTGGYQAQQFFASTFNKAFASSGGFRGFTAKEGAKFLESTASKGLFRQLGVKGTQKMVAAGGLKMAGMLGLKAAALAVPGLNVIAAISMAYDIGQMIGTGIKGGIDFVRDAGVSLRGSINKPAFGMGYRDTEAAYTSRSRGVMAIQNSRLNMRSLLGSEAGMMAAHYG